MNKSMLSGVLGGVGLATAGGVAGFVLLGEPTVTNTPQDALDAETTAITAEQPQIETVAVQATPQAAPRPSVQAAQAQTSVAPAPVEQRCWDEEVTVAVEPKDENAIAGTTAGALLGGAIAKKVGDDNNLLTIAGAVGGAYAGRRVQQRIQENNTTTRIERRCEPAVAQ